MFENLKEFLTVVQDGLTSSSNLRQTLSEVQKVKFGFHEKTQNKLRPVALEAGGSVLTHYQHQWAEIHTAAEENAVAADKLDQIITDIHKQANNRFIASSDLYKSLSALPQITSSVSECVEQLESLQQLVLQVERELQQLEDLGDRRDMEKRKMEHHHRLGLYKEKKLVALEQQRSVLGAQSGARHAERERRHLAQLAAKSEASAEAFNNDVALFKATGLVPGTRTKMTEPMQSLTLEQVELDGDSEDLDTFLNS